jgi:ABC-type multidrug transport system fused ATPase/permease subunit
MFVILNKLRILLSPKDKWKLVGIVCLMSIRALAGIAGIGLILPIIAVFTKPELMTQNKILRFYADIVGGGSTERLLIITGIFIILVYVLKNLLSFTVICLQTYFVAQKEAQLCLRLFSTYIRAPYVLHLNRGHIELGVMLLRARELCNRIILPFMCIATDFMVISTVCAVLLWTMPLITLGTIGLLSFNAGIVYLLLKKFNFSTGAVYARSVMEAEKTASDGFRSVREVKINGRTEHFIKRTRISREQVAKYWIRLYAAGQIPRLWLEAAAISQLMLFFILMLCFKVPHGTILLSFSLLIAAMSRMLPACSRINYNLTVLRQNFAATLSVLDDLKIEPEKSSETVPLEFKKEISVENVTFSYVAGTPVIKNLSLTIPRLSSTAFIGTTGSGKSTLADLILGLLKPDSGAVRVDGINIEENLASWREKIGCVPQFIYLQDASIRENVAFGIPSEEIDDEKVWSCLEIAQLDSFVNSLPEKLESFVGDNGIQLSGGQRQRIGIARALYRDPELLVLDEATSALDNETEKAFIDALKTLHGKITIIMIAHRLTTTSYCDASINLSSLEQQNA